MKARAYGEEEEFTEKESLLQDIVDDMEERARGVAARHSTSSASSRPLDAEGEAIRNMALGRFERGRLKSPEIRGDWQGERGSRGGSEEEVLDLIDNGEEEQGRDRARKRRRRSAQLQMNNGEVPWGIFKEMEDSRREVKLKKIELGEKKLKKDWEEREERMKLEGEERLALIKVLGSIASNLKK